MSIGYLILLCWSFGVVWGQSRSDLLAQNLISSDYYNPNLGLWYYPSGWWNSANSITALSNLMGYTKSTTYMNIIQNTFQKTSLPDTKNGYFDDAQWWGIAWLRAYKVSNDPQHLQRSIDIWNYVITAWDDSKCGGGLWWNSDFNYKNAITNELFLVFSTLLYEADKNTTYLDWSIKEWNWFERSGMINSDSLVNDGLDGNCKNNGQTTWTYNQGVILGGLANLYSISANSTLISIAERIAQAAMKTLIYSSGILREPCESGDCGNDGPQFKGVFMRHLGELTMASQSPIKDTFKAFIDKNAESIWANDRSSSNLCGLKWVGPNNQFVSGTTQTSALDALNAQLLTNQ